MIIMIKSDNDSNDEMMMEYNLWLLMGNGIVVDSISGMIMA